MAIRPLEAEASRASGAELALTCQRAAVAERAHRKEKRKRGEEAAQTLVDWAAGAGMAHRDWLVHVVPRIAPHASDLRGTFAGDAIVGIEHSCRTDLEVPRMMGLRSHSQVGDAFREMSFDWQRAHDVLLRKDQSPLPKDSHPIEG